MLDVQNNDAATYEVQEYNGQASEPVNKIAVLDAVVAEDHAYRKYNYTSSMISFISISSSLSPTALCR